MLVCIYVGRPFLLSLKDLNMLVLTNQIYSRYIAPLIGLSFVVSNIIKALYLMPEKSITFVLTVLATLPIRTASQGGSFAFIAFSLKHTNLLKLQFAALLEGFSFCRKKYTYDL